MTPLFDFVFALDISTPAYLIEHAVPATSRRFSVVVTGVDLKQITVEFSRFDELAQFISWASPDSITFKVGAEEDESRYTDSVIALCCKPDMADQDEATG